MKIASFDLFKFLTIIPACESSRNLRGLQSGNVSCGGVTGFSLYVPDDDALIPMPSTLYLGEYTDGKIDVIANTENDICSCVKFRFGFIDSTDYSAPYALFRDNGGKPNYGVQTLEAWSYADSDCTVERGYSSMEVEVLIGTATTPGCDFTDFFILDGDTLRDSFFFYTLDLNDYPNGEVNIVADTVGEGCMCVKLSFAGTVKKERVPPFSLYGDVNGSFLTGSPGGKDPTTETLEA